MPCFDPGDPSHVRILEGGRVIDTDDGDDDDGVSKREVGNSPGNETNEAWEQHCAKVSA